MANFDDPVSIIADVLFRMDEPAVADATSDYLAAVRRAFVRAAHDFNNKYPWPWLRSYPPGAFVTSDDISTTITIAAAGTSVAGTLGSAPSSSLGSLANRKLITSNNWFARITAHTAASTTVTLDAVPEALAAGTAVTIVQDEYQLAADLGLFVDGLWTEDGYYIELQSEEVIRKTYSDLPSAAWPPLAFCRLDQRRIRLSHYPNAVKRVEYPYCTMPDDLDATSETELTIPHNWRWVLSDATLYFAYLMKSDKRVAAADKDYKAAVEECISYARRMMMGIGSQPGMAQRSPYA